MNPFPTVPSEFTPGEHYVLLTPVVRHDGYDNDGVAWQVEVFTTYAGWVKAIELYTQQRASFVPAVLKVPQVETKVFIQVDVGPSRSD